MRRSFLDKCGAIALIAGTTSVTIYGCSQRSGGCESSESGMTVTCADAKTRAPICSEATVVAVSGTYRETLTSFGGADNGCFHNGVGTRPGTYEVTITAAGYEPQTIDITLTLTRDGCGVNGGQVDVALIPIGDAGSDTDAALVSDDASLDATSLDSSLLDASDD
jgi:hypothetical protein